MADPHASAPHASTVTVRTRRLKIAELGPENPLPAVGAWLERPYRIGPGIPADIAAAAAFGAVPNIYPYRQQDGYGRQTAERKVPAVVLENSRIRAVFLPNLGGRLWELYDKATGKQLVHTQQQIQFANLALRNAWFAGGIEWNIGTRGHSPTTCSPLHTALVHTPEGQELLRMWEFDRLREAVFQLDAWLPPDSATVFVAVRIRNPNTYDVPMYWWSNAAVPETGGTRVISPAAGAFGTDDDGGIARVRPSAHGGLDATWPAHNPRAADFFFDLAPQQRRWIVSADHDGDGLALVSSARLRGRKLFVWGQGPGGQRWQDWLSPGGGRYAEIQAGLAQTQFEHLVMPAGAAWSWVEAYGNAGLDAAPAHSADWDRAVAHAEMKVQELVPGTAVQEALAAAARWADLPPHRHVLVGGGWGALEAARRRRSRTAWIDETGTPFPGESITADQQPWLELLAGRGFAGAPTFVAGRDWEELLAAAGPGAEAALHRAIIRHAGQDFAAAEELYEQSLRLDPTALAHRGLGLAKLATDQPEAGLAQLRAACTMEPANLPLLAEAMSLHIRHGQPGQVPGMVREAPNDLAAVGRVRFLTSLALARSGHVDEAAAILKAGVEIADLREGENSLTALWLEVCPGEAVPVHYQFSMK